MKPLTIVCATSLAGGVEAFSTIGEVVALPESGIDAGSIRGADALFTRSKVKVNDTLLEGCRLQFYGTATAGVDHVDAEALARCNIAWRHAPGSNANSVAEYVVAALSWWARQRHVPWTRKILGIIGAGQVGSRLALYADALGFNILLNDPPLFEATGSSIYLPLREVLEAADVISLHVPLTDTGPHATRRMVNRAFLEAMKPGAVLVNTSRGEVVQEAELLEARRDGRVAALLLDVFDREPDISIDMLRAAALATPHIAGYSLDGRLRGTEMVYRAACRHFGLTPTWRVPEDSGRTTVSAGQSGEEHTALYDTILSAYDPARDDARLRAGPVGVPMRRHFQELRQTYPERKEFGHFRVVDQERHPGLMPLLKKIGFNVSDSPGPRLK